MLRVSVQKSISLISTGLYYCVIRMSVQNSIQADLIGLPSYVPILRLLHVRLDNVNGRITLVATWILLLFITVVVACVVCGGGGGGGDGQWWWWCV